LAPVCSITSSGTKIDGGGALPGWFQRSSASAPMARPVSAAWRWQNRQNSPRCRPERLHPHPQIGDRLQTQCVVAPGVLLLLALRSVDAGYREPIG
jgi:hypothetical protein